MNRRVLLFFCLFGLSFSMCPLLGSSQSITRKITENFNVVQQQTKTVVASMLGHIDQALNEQGVDTFCETKVTLFENGKYENLGNLNCLQVKPCSSQEEQENVLRLRQKIQEGTFSYAPPVQTNGIIQPHSNTTLIIGPKLTRQKEQQLAMSLIHVLRKPQSKL